LIVIGTSLGGLHALRLVLEGLTPGFPRAVAIVQHRVKSAESGLCGLLQRNCAIPILEPEDKEPLMSGRVYLAPADYHLLVEPESLALSTDAPVNYARPSIDVLFESAAATHGAGVLGVVLTGSNEDGAQGAKAILDAGGQVLIQDPKSAESAIMPEAALSLTGAERSYSLVQIRDELARRSIALSQK